MKEVKEISYQFILLKISCETKRNRLSILFQTFQNEKSCYNSEYDLTLEMGTCGRRIMAIMAAFQAADAGSTPAVRTKYFVKLKTPPLTRWGF